MSKKTKEAPSCRLGTVGGEAVLEGVMMKSKTRYSVAVRKEDGTISTVTNPSTSIRQKIKILNIPIIRGVVGMVESMMLSFKVLSISAEQYGDVGEEAEPSKFEKWLDKTFGKNLMDFVMVIASVLGIALALFLFMFLPTLATKGINLLFANNFGYELKDHKWLMNLIEGVIKILIFVLYLSAVSLMKDIKRTFEYHGAEHKTIFCYESGEELTPENVKKYKRFHPRCGTSFIFVILIISILIFSLPFVPWGNPFLRLLIKLPLLPVVVGIGFEFIMFAGKHDNIITRILSAPGLWMQRITTREPDLEQIEVAIAALKHSLIEEFPEVAEEEKAKDEAEAQKESAGDQDAEGQEENIENDPSDGGEDDTVGS
ncbi:MAG: DUF1385 domain-containing protein [Clostridia bacterium]|nr:DUF1385 domain-containing protein [Clostridia bacterium]